MQSAKNSPIKSAPQTTVRESAKSATSAENGMTSGFSGSTIA
jgi:hypothetical protein